MPEQIGQLPSEQRDLVGLSEQIPEHHPVRPLGTPLDATECLGGHSLEVHHVSHSCTSAHASSPQVSHARAVDFMVAADVGLA
eukprot:958504-Alexandrium_andersonii.AAC.1